MGWPKKRAQKPDEPTAENISFLDEDDNIFASSVDAGHRIDPRAQKVFILVIVLIVLYLFALIVPKYIGQTTFELGGSPEYTISWFVSDLQENITSFIAVCTGNSSIPSSYIRYVVIALAGAGLALSGAVYQGSFRNALVSPSTLGVMNGASLGLMLWVVLFMDDEGTEVPWLSQYYNSGTGTPNDLLAYLWVSYGLAVFSFIGCLLVVALVLFTMRGAGGGTSPIMMIITGQVIGGIIGAINNTVRYYYVSQDAYGIKAQLLTELQISSFYRQFSWIDIVAIAVPLLATFAVVMYLRQKMMALSLNEAETRTLGIDARRMQMIVVLLCTLLTAIIVSFCGTVGFVGFLVPHLARRLVGPNFRYLLPASTVLGAVFVLGAYVLLQMTLGADYETMVGMYISIAGAIVFLVTALRGKGAARGFFK